MRRIHLTLGLGLLLAILVACSGGPAAERQATVDALSSSIEQTAVAAAESGGDPDSAVQTAQAEGTAVSQNAAATQAAGVVQTAEAAAVTATAVAPIIAELPKYGVDPSEGSPGWVHPPVTLDVDGAEQYDSANLYLATVVRDFVISADITWNTTGEAGCGFVVRSDGNEEAPNQYLITATRSGSGTLTFVTQQDGAFFYRDGITAGVMDPNFQFQNDTTNRLTVVGRGDTFTTYTNGTRVTEQVASEFDRGFVAMVAAARSGRTVCQFNNAWLWLLN